MKTNTIETGATVKGVRAIAMENEFLRLVVLPEAGAKIWQIYYKPTGVDLLWNHPSVAPTRQPLHASYDDTWSGGWDDLFPSDEPGEVLGCSVPDHGELWTGEWDFEQAENGEAPRLHMRYGTPISHFLVEKTLALRPERAVLEVTYKLTNNQEREFPFLFKLHPAFAVTGHHRIDFPPMTVRREPEFPGTLGKAPLVFSWPDAPIGEHTIDLRLVPDELSGALHFFYGTELAAGWCGITNQASELAVGLRFDPEVFSTCWLFATHGGWRDLNVAVLEPATGYPFNMQAMIDGGQARWLAPGMTLETTVLFSVQEGLRSIGGVGPDGVIRAGDAG